MSAMNQLRLAPDDEGDLYSGFEFSDNLIYDLDEDAGLQQAIQTSYGQRPPIPAATGNRMQQVGSVNRGASRGGRLMTGVASDSGQARPMTSIRGAGFAGGVSQQFDPLKQTASKGTAPPLEKPEETPEDLIKQMEKKVNRLIEDSVVAAGDGNYQLALDKAKESGRKERQLCRQKEQNGMSDQINLDLTYAVLLNLAIQFQASHMFTDALNTYLLIVKNKMFSNSARLRINMGNIYYEQRKYPQSIKMYRMALDQIQNTHSILRLKILQNIGAVFIKMGQYTDAISTYEHIMSEKPDFKTGLNLILCYCAMRDREKLKSGFKRLLEIPPPVDDDDRYVVADEDDPQQRLLVEIIKDDSLRKIEVEEKEKAEHCILTSAKLMASIIHSNFAAGFDWCIECVSTSPYAELASELEIAKAVTFLKEREFQKAIETLKDIERKGTKMEGAAATNLSFIYYLEGEVQQAEKYACKAVSKDTYNPYALVNKGNCLFAVEQYEKARECYQEALEIEASCSEARFNLGLVHKKMSRFDEALDCFQKLHTILRSSPQVVYHIADCFDKLYNFNQATDWFLKILSLTPTDPQVLQRMADMFDADGDKPQAYHYYSESFRYDPANIDVISWLGAYFMEAQLSDKAVHYFERAALLQPNEINWHILVASCHRKTGNYQRALETYRKIHEHFPENLECLKFLIRLCTDMGLAKQAQEYAVKLKKAEKREASADRKKKTSRIPSAGSDMQSFESGTSSGPSSAKRREIDANYLDPLGDLPERPKTSVRSQKQEDNDFNDVELGDDLLPE